LETGVWGAYYNVAVNLEGLRDKARREELQTEMNEAVRVAQEGMQLVLSTLSQRKNK
jgi:formiminotetrahydrofolate cyclodeaminase